MRRLMTAFLAVLLVLSFTPSASAQGTNLIRVMHASPDAPAVDIYVNGGRVLANVPFFTTSGYLRLADGAYSVDIVPAGAAVSSAVWSGTLEVSGNYVGTVTAINTLSNFEVILYDDEIAPPADGLTRVSVIHASPDAPAVDIKLAGTNTAVVQNAAFTQGAILEVPAGTYAFDISAAGQSAVVFTTPQLVFLPGWSYTLVATGELTKGGFWVQSVVDNYITADGRAALGGVGGTGTLTSK